MGLFMSFLFGSILGILITIGTVIFVIVLIIGVCFLTSNRAIDTPNLLDDANSRAQNKANAEIQEVSELAELEGSALSAKGRANMSLRSRGGFAPTLMIMLLLVVCVACRVEFGEVRGRFPCERTLVCGRDVTYHEIRFRVYPLESNGTWTTTPWLFGPLTAGDTLSGPMSCDPRKAGQCYVMNTGNLTVSVRPTPLFWLNALTRHPTYEFPAAYKISSEVIDGPITPGFHECERLVYDPDLFGDAGPCWKHQCTDGMDVVDTETIGIGPGCGLFTFTHLHARPTTGLEIVVRDVERGSFLTLALDDIRPGIHVSSANKMAYAHVDTISIPGGVDTWVYPEGLQGGVVACDWRNTWELHKPGVGRIDHLPTHLPATLNASWYYVSQDRIGAAYSKRDCGMNGPGLSRLARELSSFPCDEVPNFANGTCLPSVWPINILNGSDWDPEYVPPTKRSALASRVALWESRIGRRAVVHLADEADFLPGPVFYEVVLRVGTPMARTDKDNTPIFHSALCVEENALSCVQDPNSLVARIDVYLGNRSPNSIARNVTATVWCTYDDGGETPVLAVNKTFDVGTLTPANNFGLGLVFDLPPEAVRYQDDGTPVGRSNISFQCDVRTDTPFGDYNATYAWNGTVSCSEFLNPPFIPQDLTVDCSRSDTEMACRIQHGTVGESGWYVFYVVLASFGLAIDLILAVWIYHRMKDRHSPVPAAEMAGIAGPPPST